MEQISLNKLTLLLRYCIGLLMLITFSALLFSFKAKYVAGNLFNQLGITQANADEKIANSIIGGYLDAYGAKNVKNIALGNRSALAKDLLSYTKQYVNSDAFKKGYVELKERNKPAPIQKEETPDEMRTHMIKNAKEGLQSAEETLKKAAPEFKKIFEENVDYSRKNLKEAEDPANKYQNAYKKNYPELVKSQEQSEKYRLEEWEKQYPSNYLLFVKVRLQQFLIETKEIDFTAELTEKNGKKIFVKPVYERKGNRWKMAFRAGKEVVEPARAFAGQWIGEIK